jgi:hypothetical protein
VHPLAVAEDVVAVVRLLGADNGPVLADGHLGLVKVNGKHGFLHVGVAQSIGVNVLPVFWKSLCINLRVNLESQGHK